MPAYSRPAYEVNATEGKFQLLLTEGKCFLSCLQYYYYDGVRNNILRSVNYQIFKSMQQLKYMIMPRSPFMIRGHHL